MKTFTFVNSVAQKNLLFRLYKHYIIDSILVVKNHGFKELVRQRGKKFFIGVIGYYAVRDSIVYIIIPLCIAREIF